MKIRLKEWRERRLLTQEELALRIGVSVGTINRIERGVHEPRFSTIRKLAAALDVAPDDLVIPNLDTQHRSQNDTTQAVLRVAIARTSVVGASERRKFTSSDGGNKT